MCTRILGLCTAWCSEIGSLMSLNAPGLHAFSDVGEPFSLHQAVDAYWYMYREIVGMGPFQICHSSHPAPSFCGSRWVASQNGFHWILDTMSLCAQAPLYLLMVYKIDVESLQIYSKPTLVLPCSLQLFCFVVLFVDTSTFPADAVVSPGLARLQRVGVHPLPIAAVTTGALATHSVATKPQHHFTHSLSYLFKISFLVISSSN